MLRLFTEALGDFLVDRLSSMPLKPTASFALPGTIIGRNAVNLFLSSIAEDAGLRSNELQYERTEIGWLSTPPPLRLKCTYIISAWPASDDPAEAALAQQQILGEAYRVLVHAGTLPAAYIPPFMKSPNIPAPVIAISKDELHNRPEFWLSTGCTFRPAFSLAATVALPIVEEHYDHIVEGVQTDYKISPSRQ